MADDESLAEKAARPEEQHTSQAPATPPATQPPPATATALPLPKQSYKQLVPIGIFALAALLFFVIYGLWNSWSNTFSLKTDDAYVRTDIAPLSTREHGIVAKTFVNDFQKVTAGQSLIELRNDDFKDRVTQSQEAVSEVLIKIDDMKSRKSKLDALIQEAKAQLENSRQGLHQFDATIAIAKANIAEAVANLEAASAAIKQSEAGVQSAIADTVKTAKERKREESLLQEESSTKERLEQVEDEYERSQAALANQKAAHLKAKAEYAGKSAQILRAKQQLSSVLSDKAKAETTVQSRLADLTARTMERKLLDGEEKQLQTTLIAKKAAADATAIDLGYTTIKAPVSGTVGELKVKVGQFVNAGTQVITLVSAAPWVIANFRETQTAKIKAGDPARIDVDALPGKHWQGRVESIAPASGAQFSLLPPDNASGNFTKVTQRIPVKIVFADKDQDLDSLRPGMSVTATISPQ